MPRYSWHPGAYREHVRLRCKAERSGAELRSLRRAHSARRARFKIKSRAKESATCVAGESMLEDSLVRNRYPTARVGR